MRPRYGALLVCTSSVGVQFCDWQMRPKAECLGNPARWMHGQPIQENVTGDDHPCFRLFRVPNGAKHLCLVNGRFPVSLDGGVDPIAPERIRLTRTLLYLDAVQASPRERAGLHALEYAWQNRLMREFRSRTAGRAD